MSSQSFAVGERVYAKMKGFPPWPAQVRGFNSGKFETYHVVFYGTYESAKLKKEFIYPYNEETKARLGKPRRVASFNEALAEMENNVQLDLPTSDDAQPKLPPATADADLSLPILTSEAVDDDEGDLVIDETPIKPPVLKKEAKVAPLPSKKVKKEPKAQTPPVLQAPIALNAPIDEIDNEEPVASPLTSKQPRRNSKPIIKRDSISTTTAANTTTTTPEPVIPTTPQPEITSRSGRKIKPKRFADEEVQFGSTPTAKALSSGTEEGKLAEPARRAVKRVASNGSKSSTPALVPISREVPVSEIKIEAEVPADKPVVPISLPPLPPLERPKLTAVRNAKTKHAFIKNPNATTSRPPPPLIPAMPTLSRAPNIQRHSPPPAKLKKIDAVAKSKVKAKRPSDVPKSAPTRKVERSDAPKEEKPDSDPDEVKQKNTIPRENIELESANIKAEPKEQENEVELKVEAVQINEEEDVKPQTSPKLLVNDEAMEEQSAAESPSENIAVESKQESMETDDESTEKENKAEEANLFENGLDEECDEAPIVPKRMKVDLKNGAASVVLSFNHDRPAYFRTEIASVEYDMSTARSVLQTKTQLEINETPFLKSIIDSLPSKDEPKHQDVRSKAEMVQKKIAQLRMEGEVIEIVGELVGSLGMKYAFCDRALDLLDKLASRTDVNTLALKKNPEIVDVIRQVQNYHGNVARWSNLTQTQIDDFHVKAEMIRDKAISIYQSFKLLFCTQPGRTFRDTFSEEVDKFSDLVVGMTQTAIFSLYEEPKPKDGDTTSNETSIITQDAINGANTDTALDNNESKVVT